MARRHRFRRVLRVVALRPSLLLSARAAARLPTLAAALRAPWTRRVLRATPSVLRPPWQIATSPAVVGAAYLLGIAAGEAGGPKSEDVQRILGDGGRRISRALATQFRDDVSLAKLRVVLLALGIGAALGLLAGYAVRRLAAGRVGRGAQAGAVLLVVASLHAAVAGWSIAMYPALYDEALRAQGGSRHALQIFVTDRLGPAGAVLVPASVAAAVLLAVGWRGRRSGALSGPPVTAPLRWGALTVVVLLVLATLPDLRAVSRPPRSAGPPSVLVLAADSLRDDHFDAETMPRLSALAARGARFSRQYSSIARTMPSWVTLLSGQYPHHHGIRSSYPRAEDAERAFLSLPRQLAASGYSTAVVTDYGGDVFRGANFGFGQVDGPALTVPEYISAQVFAHAHALVPFTFSGLGRKLLPGVREVREAATPGLLADEAIARMRALDDRPFFLVVFFSATHDPYATSYPYYRRFGVPGYDGPYRYLRSIQLRTQPTPEDVAQARALYRGAATAVDDASARILDELEAEGRSKDTIVVFTSDHGEELPGSASFSHGTTLFGDGQNHVPLAIFDPRPTAPAPVVVAERTRDVDLAPTLYELTGTPAPSDMDGSSLGPRLRGQGMPEPTIFAETELWLTVPSGVAPEMRIPYPPMMDVVEVDHARHDTLAIQPEYDVITTFAKHRMAFDGRMKLVYAPTPTGAKYLLFDTTEDPENLRDVAGVRPEEPARPRWPRCGTGCSSIRRWSAATGTSRRRDSAWTRWTGPTSPSTPCTAPGRRRSTDSPPSSAPAPGRPGWRGPA